MKMLFKNLFLLFVFYLSGCGGSKEIEIKVTEVVEPVVEADELNYKIKLAYDFSGVVYLDNTPCNEIVEEVIRLACERSNFSYSRVLGFDDFNDSVAIAFVPYENWEEFREAYKHTDETVGGFCDYSVFFGNKGKYKNVVSAIFIPYGQPTFLETLNHERAHCTLGSHTEVTSMLLGFHLTNDYALYVNDKSIQPIEYGAYGGSSYSSTEVHAIGMASLRGYLKEYYIRNGDFSGLINNYYSNVLEWGSDKWLNERIDSIDWSAEWEYVRLFMVEFVHAHPELYPPCSQGQIDSEDCVLSKFLDRYNTDKGAYPVDEYNPTLPSTSFRMDYIGTITNAKLVFTASKIANPEDVTFSVELDQYQNNIQSEYVYIPNYTETDFRYYVNITSQDGSVNVFDEGSVEGRVSIWNLYKYNMEEFKEIIEVKDSDVCDSYVTDSGTIINTPGILVEVISTASSRELTVLPCQ